MRVLWIALLSLGLLTGPAAAATIKPADLVVDGGGGLTNSVINVTLNFITQLNMPVTISQTYAIGINSSHITAISDTTSISTNDAAVFTANLTSPLAVPLLENAFWQPLLAALGLGVPQPPVDQSGYAGPGNGGAVAPIPLPATLPLALAALAGLGLLGWRRRGVPEPS